MFAFMDLFIGIGVFVLVFEQNRLSGSFSSVLSGICFICLAVALILLSLMVPVTIRKEMPFMFRHIGKGCFYIFLSSVLGQSSGSGFGKFFFWIGFIVGVAWIVFNFIPNFPVAQPFLSTALSSAARATAHRRRPPPPRPPRSRRSLQRKTKLNAKYLYNIFVIRI